MSAVETCRVCGHLADAHNENNGLRSGGCLKCRCLVWRSTIIREAKR